jgi:hypothetical protein
MRPVDRYDASVFSPTRHCLETTLGSSLRRFDGRSAVRCGCALSLQAKPLASVPSHGGQSGWRVWPLLFSPIFIRSFGGYSLPILAYCDREF